MAKCMLRNQTLKSTDKFLEHELGLYEYYWVRNCAVELGRTENIQREESIGALWVWGEGRRHPDTTNSPSESWGHQHMTWLPPVLTYGCKSDLGLMSQRHGSGATRWHPFPFSLSHLCPSWNYILVRKQEEECIVTNFSICLKHFKHKNIRKWNMFYMEYKKVSSFSSTEVSSTWYIQGSFL